MGFQFFFTMWCVQLSDTVLCSNPCCVPPTGPLLRVHLQDERPHKTPTTTELVLPGRELLFFGFERTTVLLILYISSLRYCQPKKLQLVVHLVFIYFYIWWCFSTSWWINVLEHSWQIWNICVLDSYKIWKICLKKMYNSAIFIPSPWSLCPRIYRYSY